MIDVERDDVQLRIEGDDEAFHNLPCLPCHPTIALDFRRKGASSTSEHQLR